MLRVELSHCLLACLFMCIGHLISVLRYPSIGQGGREKRKVKAVHPVFGPPLRPLREIQGGVERRVHLHFRAVAFHCKCMEGPALSASSQRSERNKWHECPEPLPTFSEKTWADLSCVCWLVLLAAWYEFQVKQAGRALHTASAP